MKKKEEIGAMRNGKVYFFNVLTTKTIDMVTWGQMYKSGYREPRFRPPSIYCMSLISNKVDQRACDINILDFSLSLLMDPDLYH